MHAPSFLFFRICVNVIDLFPFLGMVVFWVWANKLSGTWVNEEGRLILLLSLWFCFPIEMASWREEVGRGRGGREGERPVTTSTCALTRIHIKSGVGHMDRAQYRMATYSTYSSSMSSGKAMIVMLPSLHGDAASVENALKQKHEGEEEEEG